MRFKDPVVGQSGDVHTSALNKVGMEVEDIEGGRWKYLKGVASLAAGRGVTYNGATGDTALLAANAKGPVAVADPDTTTFPTATQYGWFQVISGPSSRIWAAANCAANAQVGREGADGAFGDGRAAGDEVYNMWTRGATAGAAALVAADFRNPFVDDANGA
jgi:hypothetical protein